MDNTAKYLRVIAAVAVVLTILMIGYTMAAVNGSNSYRPDSEPQVADNIHHQNPAVNPVPENLFPQDLAGMARVQSFTGQDAIDMVSSMYRTNTIKADKAYVVGYQSSKGGQMAIWYGETDTAQEAAVLQESLDAMMPTDKDYSNYHRITIEGKQISSVTGMELQNYYWQDGKRVMWVGFTGVKDSEALLKQIVHLF